MRSDTAAMLKLFFEIPPDRIAADVAAGLEDFDRVMRDTPNRPEQPDKESPDVAADRCHKSMVRARAVYSHPNMSDEFRLHFVGMAANHIAEEAVFVADGKGRLAELGSQMEAIRTREGLTDEEYWPIGEGPDDYRGLVDASDELYDRVRDTVFVTVLRRYDLGGVADLYEGDRERYELLVERGRVEVFGPLDDE